MPYCIMPLVVMMHECIGIYSVGIGMSEIDDNFLVRDVLHMTYRTVVLLWYYLRCHLPSCLSPYLCLQTSPTQPDNVISQLYLTAINPLRTA